MKFGKQGIFLLMVKVLKFVLYTSQVNKIAFDG